MNRTARSFNPTTATTASLPRPCGTGWRQFARPRGWWHGHSPTGPRRRRGQRGVDRAATAIAQLIERLTQGFPLNRANAQQSSRLDGCWPISSTGIAVKIRHAWWEYFRLSALSDEELLDERSALSGLVFIGPAGGTAKAPIHRYSFPLQETDIRGGEELQSQGGSKLGAVTGFSFEDRTIDIKKRKDTNSFHPTAVFAHEVINSRVLADALLRIRRTLRPSLTLACRSRT